MIGSEKGSVLIIIIVGITIIAAIGAGVSTMRSSSGIQFLIDKSDNNLSVQADYAAESGLERARFELNKAHKNSPDDTVKGWQKVCKNGLKKLSEDIESNISFIIDDASVSTNAKGEAEGCEVTVTGWVGPDMKNPLAKKTLKKEIKMAVMPPPPPDIPGPADTVYYAVSSAEKTITLPFKASVDGHVYGKDVVLSSQAAVTGDVVAEKDVTLEFKSSVAGDICASEEVTLASQVKVGGDIHAHNNVTVGWNSDIAGDIYADGNVKVESDVTVMGSIHSDKSVTIGWNSVVEGDIFAGGEVILEGKAQVLGSVYAKKAVRLGSKDTVSGDVITEGDIDLLAGQNLIEGNAIASGEIQLGWKSVIKGKQLEGQLDPGVEPPLPPKECPGVEAPKLSIFSAGKKDISLGWKEDGDIEPGAYHDLKTGGKNSIYFTRADPGECKFVFSTMSLAWDLDLYLDLSQCEVDGEPGDMTIFSEKDIQFGGKMNIYIITDDGKPKKMKDVDPEIAKRIYWETHGDFFQGGSSDWFGTILAEKNIWFNSHNMRLTGAAASVKGTVTIGHSVDMTYMPANYAVENW
jgi:predicted acyltransferase (DUF342 family)